MGNLRNSVRIMGVGNGNGLYGRRTNSRLVGDCFGSDGSPPDSGTADYLVQVNENCSHSREAPEYRASVCASGIMRRSNAGATGSLGASCVFMGKAFTARRRSWGLPHTRESSRELMFQRSGGREPAVMGSGWPRRSAAPPSMAPLLSTWIRRCARTRAIFHRAIRNFGAERRTPSAGLS